MLNIIAGDLKYWFAVVHWFWSGTVDCMKWSEVYREVSAYIANPSKFQPDELRLAQRHTRLLDRGHVWEGSISAVPCLTNIFWKWRRNQRCKVQIHFWYNATVAIYVLAPRQRTCMWLYDYMNREWTAPAQVLMQEFRGSQKTMEKRRTDYSTYYNLQVTGLLEMGEGEHTAGMS